MNKNSMHLLFGFSMTKLPKSPIKSAVKSPASAPPPLPPMVMDNPIRFGGGRMLGHGSKFKIAVEGPLRIENAHPCF